MNGLSRILVVDDDAGLRRTLERILTPAYHVEAVTGASKAMACLEDAAADRADRQAGHRSLS